MPKRKAPPQHPLDSSGVLQAAKFGEWAQFRQNLDDAADLLTFEILNELPPGRSYGVIHQICYHGDSEAADALQYLLAEHPRADLTFRTQDGQTPWQVARENEAEPAFLDQLRQARTRQALHELINLARDGKWDDFRAKLMEQQSAQEEEDEDGDLVVTIDVNLMNSVPEGRIWGVLHQIAYWGRTDMLELLWTVYDSNANNNNNNSNNSDHASFLDLELETREEAAQVPRDIAIGRGHHEFATLLQTKIDQLQQNQKQQSKVTAPSSSMKTPVPAAGKLCNICYMEDHEPDVLAVCCDNQHYICQECFGGWVASESNIEANPQNILLNGGRITCVCAKSDGCESLAYANKLIAMVVADDVYEQYLKARDFVVGKEAVAGALSKIKSSDGSMDAVEQESIRNMYRLKDGTYSAYMCGQCSFGPIDHGWCNNLQTHHGEKKPTAGGSSHINNACPQCGWFANDISQWPRWNGKFVKNNPTKFTPKPVTSMTVAELRNALKSRGAPAYGSKTLLQARLQALYDQESNNSTS